MAAKLILQNTFPRKASMFSKPSIRRRAPSGFSLIEVVISMAILTTGLVSLLGVFGLAMATTQTSQDAMIAKQLANESYESIITARNTTQIDWDDIQNTGSVNCPITGASSCGIFLAPMESIYNAGVDGIYGTADDAAAGEQTLQDPGPDGVFLTTDDLFIPLTGFQRQITISPLYDSNGNLISSVRSVTITVNYVNPQTKLPQSYILNSYISQFE
ncbi:MAG: prepilin-type N-terminal cleavage/methylation domain-containing protein [Terriglobales bacterium]|jgi:prepilin-type N-terminal cleavage/methylation domain-containing protein